MSTTPIADHALLSDRHSSALVDKAGSVEWLCFPRFDSPSVFGRILDDDAGHWSIRPTSDFEVQRRYLDDSLVLETTFRTADGTLRITDALALGPDNDEHRLGIGAPHLLVRAVTCVSGEVEVDVSYRPRPEYGLVTSTLNTVDGGVTARGGAEWLVLTAPMELATGDSTATGRRRLTTGEDAALRAAPLDAGRDSRPRVVAGGPGRGAGQDGPLVAVVGGAAPVVRRALARPRAPQRPSPAGLVVPVERRHRRRPHHLAA